MAAERSFPLSEELSDDAVRAAIESAFRTGTEAPHDLPVTYLDTFDWRLFHAGWMLRALPGDGERSEEGWELTLAPRAAEAPGHPPRLVMADLPTFAWKLPVGALADTVAPIIGNRRLLPQVTVRRRGFGLPLLDGEDKTVAHLRVEERSARPPGGRKDRPLPRRVSLLPLTGYEAEAERAAAVLAGSAGDGRGGDGSGEGGLGLAPGPGELEEALEAVGRKAGEPSSKIRFSLSPDEPAGRAVPRVHRRLFDTMLANEPGARAALDVEFLHDYRVALRRLRSALTQIPCIYPPEKVEHWRAELAWLGRVTGSKRDHDVFLETLDDYLEGLPEWVREGLEGLRAFLLAREGQELEELTAALDSDRYRRLVRGFRHLLASAGEAGEGGEPANARRPVVEVASERLRRLSKKIARGAAALTPATPAEDVHRLRIRAKKYRYLLEIFRDLYPDDRIRDEVKILKKLQDQLGTFNDLDTQRLTLRHLAARMERGEAAVPPAVPLAMGYLIARLEERQAEVRRRLDGALKTYLKKRKKRGAGSLFRRPEQEGARSKGSGGGKP